MSEEEFWNAPSSILSIYREDHGMMVYWGEAESPSAVDTLRATLRFLGTGVHESTPHPIATHEQDFIFEFSSYRLIADEELSGRSLAELRIARNEIFARHGRQFADPLLYSWFNSKQWYQAISPKFTPTQFYALRPIPLSSLEHDNVYRLIAHEESILQAGRVFPHGNSIRLTEFDIILSREVLRRGLDEIYTYAGASGGNRDALNDVERHNAELIEHALSLSNIRF